MIEPHLAVDPRIWERIEAKFIPEPNSGCWIWTGGHAKNGYSMFRVKSRKSMVHVHRYLYERCNGIVLARWIFACHSCDNPWCINPRHVFPGTPKDNRDDAMRKGRLPIAERNGNARLSTEQALAILASDESDNVLAARYGVAAGTIWALRKGISWRHIR